MVILVQTIQSELEGCTEKVTAELKCYTFWDEKEDFLTHKAVKRMKGRSFRLMRKEFAILR